MTEHALALEAFNRVMAEAKWGLPMDQSIVDDVRRVRASLERPAEQLAKLEAANIRLLDQFEMLDQEHGRLLAERSAPAPEPPPDLAELRTLCRAVDRASMNYGIARVLADTEDDVSHRQAAEEREEKLNEARADFDKALERLRGSAPAVPTEALNEAVSSIKAARSCAYHNDREGTLRILDAALSPHGLLSMAPAAREITPEMVEAAARAQWMHICDEPGDPTFDGTDAEGRKESLRVAEIGLRAALSVVGVAPQPTLEDTARLDWLEANHYVTESHDSPPVFVQRDERWPSFRKAIDAARLASSPRSPNPDSRWPCLKCGGLPPGEASGAGDLCYCSPEPNPPSTWPRSPEFETFVQENSLRGTLSEEVSVQPFELIPIPEQEVERETKAFGEKFFPHEDLDGMEPYDWREDATFTEATQHGYIDGPTSGGYDMKNAAARWYTFKRHRALTVSDPTRPGWAAFRIWALETLASPPTPEPDPWPTYDAEVYQAERLRRASSDD